MFARYRSVSVVIFTALCVTGPAIAGEPFRAAADRPLDILHIALDLTVDVPKKTVSARAAIDVVALRDVTSILLCFHRFRTSASP